MYHVKRAALRKASASKQPDFRARLKRIYGPKMLRVNGAQLVAEERAGRKS